MNSYEQEIDSYEQIAHIWSINKIINEEMGQGMATIKRYALIGIIFLRFCLSWLSRHY